LLFSSCIFGNYTIHERLRENRTGLIGTNIIGIVGESSDVPYIEIQYSIADENNHGKNITAAEWISPPYVFKNENVYMTYEYFEDKDHQGPLSYVKTLLRDFEEGGAEYLRIINHSQDKPVEFFFAGTQEGLTNNGDLLIPSVWYKNAPIYYLLFPNRKPYQNIIFGGIIFYFEGDRIGDLIVTEAWSIEEVHALYCAEYARSNEIMLIVDSDYRMIDLVEGKISGWNQYQGNIFHGVIEPGKELLGNEKIWLLATPGAMFFEVFERGDLR